VKLWRTWALIVNIVVSVPTCFRRNIPYVTLLIISGSLDHSWIWVKSYDITHVVATHISYCEIFWNWDGHPNW
jgi:hypothetical protein